MNNSIDTNVLTHIAVLYNKDEILVPELVKIRFDDNYCPKSTVFAINDDVSFVKSEIRYIKKAPCSKKSNKQTQERAIFLNKYNLQKKAFETFKKEHADEWLAVLEVAEAIVLERESKFIIKYTPKMLKKIIEAEARIACGVGINATEETKEDF